eukprot:scaffold30_cov166-Ochromonas_danica.AAC.6
MHHDLAANSWFYARLAQWSFVIPRSLFVEVTVETSSLFVRLNVSRQSALPSTGPAARGIGRAGTRHQP